MSTKLLRYFIVVLVTAIAIFITSTVTAEVDNNYLQQGKQYYDRGQYTEALRLWQQVANEDREIENKIVGYSYLAIADLILEEWSKSRKAIAFI